ncbi:S8 family serine peptidase [Shewanella sp. SG41-4]|uniref:S8 family serine peptidase n=1 Tax=Shewanella sp. SG41-4 TaxID=2760976 RepID=UPI00160431CE|nr:S8 family serine peptidase [Shewanella sp. SG41-4]MBB1437768.1 S8 family serine peptidase [Shewanella sp. SG41-4]
MRTMKKCKLTLLGLTLGLTPLLTLAPLEANAQLLPITNLPNTVIDNLDRTINRNAERMQQLKQQRLIEQQLQRTLAIKAKLVDPLLQLPSVLPVLNTKGQLLWNDVQVEMGQRAIEREWLLLLTPAQWQQLVSAVPTLSQYVQNRKNLDSLGLQLINIQVPESIDNWVMLRQQLPELLAPYLSRNFIYQPQTESPQQEGAHIFTTDSAEVNATAMCQLPISLGMVDTAITPKHDAWPTTINRFTLIQQDFLPEAIPTSYSHGTAVAGVLAGEGAELSPLLPSLTLYSAGAFYAQNEYQQGATLESILQALNWLVERKNRVINMSLTGPDNPVLNEVVNRLVAKDIILVAAAGNGGPAAAPLYPAAYDGVIAVTAVDNALQLYRWANQGEYVDFAAPGVKVLTARADGSIGPESGTSMATPVVSAKVACILAASPTLTLAQVLQTLQQQALDLGTPGKDSQYGYGLLTRPLKAGL